MCIHYKKRNSPQHGSNKHERADNANIQLVAYNCTIANTVLHLRCGTVVAKFIMKIHNEKS